MDGDGAREHRGRIRWGHLAVVVVTISLIGPVIAADTPTTCSPQLERAPDQIAPHLQIVQTVAGNGTCPAIQVLDSSPDGSTIWGGDSHGGLWRSHDDLTSWTRVYQLPPTYQRVMNVLQLRSGFVLIHVIDQEGAEQVLRSIDTSATGFSSVPSLNFPAGSTLHGSPSWAEGDNAVYVANYGTQPNPVVLWKSTDDGRSFSPIFQLAGYPSKLADSARHFHDVLPDPYRAGRIWLTVGDHPGARIGYSDDGGRTFTWITTAYPEGRAVMLLFAPAAVFWATDAGDAPNDIWRWDRANGALTKVRSNVPGPYYDGRQYSGMFAQFQTVTLASDLAYTDEYPHVITARADGSDWSVSRLPWQRDPARPDRTAIQQLITRPDSHGRFWVVYSHLVDDQLHGVSDIEFQFGDPAPPSATTRPVVSGEPEPGSVLSATRGAWSGDPTAFAYRWSRCDSAGNGCSTVRSGPENTYTLTSGDSGYRIRATVTATSDAGTGSSVSTPTGIVGAPLPTARPVLSGILQPGQVLSATAGAWGGSPTAFTYAWSRCDKIAVNCSVVAGGGRTYALTAADVAHRMRVTVTATNDIGAAAYGSAPTGVVGTPVVVARPIVTGALQPGQTVSATTGTWSGSPTSFSYQWSRCDSTGNNCIVIGSAPEPERVLTVADATYRLRVKVTATNLAGSGTSTSSPSGVIGAPLNTGRQPIIGILRPGQKLAASGAGG